MPIHRLSLIFMAPRDCANGCALPFGTRYRELYRPTECTNSTRFPWHPSGNSMPGPAGILTISKLGGDHGGVRDWREKIPTVGSLEPSEFNWSLVRNTVKSKEDGTSLACSRFACPLNDMMRLLSCGAHFTFA